MYNQFCKNLNNYILLNDSNDYRSALGRELLLFLDPDKFNALKASGDQMANKFELFLARLLREDNRKFKDIVWELYAYGFDISLEELSSMPLGDKTEKEKDKTNVVNLLFGSTYWLDQTDVS